MEEFDFDKMDREAAAIEERMTKIEEKGIENTLKYFDRIHDHLFNFNNLLIAGYFALASLNKPIGMINILFPVGNMVLLIYIEYRMMRTSRIQSNIKSKSLEGVQAYNKQVENTNLYSLIAITSTMAVTIIFTYLLLKL